MKADVNEPDVELRANRSGRLTEAQRKQVLHAVTVEKRRALFRILHYSILPMLSIPALLFEAAQALHWRPQLPGLGGGLIAYAIGAAFVIRDRRRAALAAQEAQLGSVTSVAGVIEKLRYAQIRQFRSPRVMFKILVDGYWLMCWGALADAAARIKREGGEARAYHLPRSQWLVNIERT